MYGNKDSRVDFGLEHWGLKQNQTNHIFNMLNVFKIQNCGNQKIVVLRFNTRWRNRFKPKTSLNLILYIKLILASQHIKHWQENKKLILTCSYHLQLLVI